MKAWAAPPRKESDVAKNTLITDVFPTDPAGLPEGARPEVVELADGDSFELEIAPVAKRLGETTVRMLAYNDSIPGPTLRVEQGSTVTVNVVNRGDLEATVHWHGLRLDNRYDGTHETQAPIPIGGSFSYEIQFPDPGVYWYHPHIREDYGQEMGLYGNIVVAPAEANYWPSVNLEVVLTLDDVLVEDGTIVPFSRLETTFAAMGRYGNVLLVNGETDLSLSARRGEVVRFYLTNTANSRVFKVALPGARMKLVGGDSGRYEREQFVDEVILAPSERVVVDVLFEEAGELALEHRTPERTYTLAEIAVGEDAVEPSLVREFDRLRTAPELVAERERLTPYIAAAPDKTVALVAEMELGGPEVEQGAVYACPMHPEIIASWAGKCPKCGMKLVPAAADVEAPSAYACPMHPDVTATWAATCPKCGMTLRAAEAGGESSHGDHGHMTTHEGMASHDEHGAGHEQSGGHEHNGGHMHGTAEGIEWEDDMVEVNRMTTPSNMRWKVVDRTTGAEGHAIQWQFRVGDRVKIRLVNEMDSDHPMHHPFHIHGAGRFLILARDGVVEENLVWKDTVLVRTGETVDVLLDVTNPGRWMAHCHIAEHHESGMMFSFDVAPADDDPSAVDGR
jgi:FtsP/CotA-like multicopper oxidase with cupredoxin domain